MMRLLANWIHYEFHVSKFNHIINWDLRVSRKFDNLDHLDYRYTNNFGQWVTSSSVIYIGYSFVDSIARYIYDIHDNQIIIVKCIEFSWHPLYKWNIVYHTIIIAPKKVQNGLNNTIACLMKIRIRRNYQEYNCVVKLIKRKIR